MKSFIPDWFYKTEIHGRYNGYSYSVLIVILAFGVFLRFWNLGYAGLHGDEDLVALAVRGFLEHGEPLLPAGWLYYRAFPHTVMIASSVYLFGDTEWAIRLPSAIIGSLFGLVAFFLGKRFLEPRFNLLFVAFIALSPVMVGVSQIGRMYAFLIFFTMLFMVLIFRWDRTQKSVDLFLAFVIWCLGLLFHSLIVFFAPLFLLPGVTRRSWPLSLQGAAFIVGGFFVYKHWSTFVSGFYPRMPGPPMDGPLPGIELAEFRTGFLAFEWLGWAGLVLGVLAGVFVVYVLNDSRRPHVKWAAILLGIGVFASAAMQFHIAAVALGLGVVALFRSGERLDRRLWLVLIAVGLIGIGHFLTLYSSGIFDGRRFPEIRVLDAMMGWPAVWPFVRLALYNPLASAIVFVIALVLAVRFSKGWRLPDYALLFIIGVWLPLFAMGHFGMVASRYVITWQPLILLMLVAGVGQFIRELESRTPKHKQLLAYSTIVVLGLMVVHPLQLSVVAANDYRSHPDHKGGAEYVSTNSIRGERIVIAEDSINQTYYLGSIDFRLRSSTVHTMFIDGKYHCLYTGVPYITSGEELEAVLERSVGRDVYIIGTGEGMVERGRQNSIRDVLASDRLKVVYEGRDGRTKVWAPKVE